MDPSVQNQTSQPAASSVQAEPVQQPAVVAPSTAPPPVLPKKRGLGNIFIGIGFLLTFMLGIGFNKYHVASYVSAVHLPKFVTVTETPKPSPVPKATPSPTVSPTTGWKTFISSDLTFQYPSDWTVNGNLIATSSPKIKLVVVPKSSTLINDCMQQVGAMTLPDYIVKKFIRITAGEACATGDATPRELWVVPTEIAKTPGISFSYSATEATQAGQLFTQLLTTFKFLKGEASPSATPTASPSAVNYKCSSGEYVDCMPVLTPEKQAACTPEAMAWYKVNCPNFKGAAM
jgi:hypothetical protein